MYDLLGSVDRGERKRKSLTGSPDSISMGTLCEGRRVDKEKKPLQGKARGTFCGGSVDFQGGRGRQSTFMRETYQGGTTS